VETAQFVTVSTEWLIQNVTSIAIGLAILVAGWLFAKAAATTIRKTLPKRNFVDQTFVPILAQTVRYGILVVTLVMALAQFGVQTTSILAVLGAAGLAIALALQGTLSNIAAGVMLVWLRPMAVGEYIDGNGISGTIVEIGLFGTRLRTANGLFLFAPNSKLWDTSITNYSREPRRRVEIRVGISYDSNIKRARDTLSTMALADRRILSEPKPAVYVETLGDSAVGLLLRCWASTPDYWDVKFGFTEQAKLMLEEEGIEIPYNKLDVNLIGQKHES